MLSHERAELNVFTARLQGILSPSETSSSSWWYPFCFSPSEDINTHAQTTLQWMQVEGCIALKTYVSFTKLTSSTHRPSTDQGLMHGQELHFPPSKDFPNGKKPIRKINGSSTSQHWFHCHFRAFLWDPASPILLHCILPLENGVQMTSPQPSHHSSSSALGQLSASPPPPSSPEQLSPHVGLKHPGTPKLTNLTVLLTEELAIGSKSRSCQFSKFINWAESK